MKKKLVPATTNNITKAIIQFLNSKGHFAFRVNTTGTYDPFNKTFRKIAKENRGCPDILCCMRFDGGYEETTHGQFVGIEIKNESTKDRLSEDQKLFHKKAGDANAHILIIKSWEDFKSQYENRYEWGYGNPLRNIGG